MSDQKNAHQIMEEAQTKVHETLDSLSDALGPAAIDRLTEEESDSLDYLDILEEDGPSPENVLLNEWIIVASWVDLESNAIFVTTIESKNLSEYVQLGLLHEALLALENS